MLNINNPYLYKKGILMKKLLFLILSISTLFAVTNETSTSLEKKHLHKQLEKEKKYAQEQKFYMGEDYNLNSFEVDEESLKNIPDQPDYNNEFDMDSVYD